MHVVDPSQRFLPLAFMAVADWLRQLASLVPQHAAWLLALSDRLDGVAPHDPGAVGRFKRFLENSTINDPDWCDVPAWLVDTGDVTTFGDAMSLSRGLTHLSDFAAAAAIPPDRVLKLHGNHDAWPDGFPLWAPPGAIETWRTTLRTLWYDTQWPAAPLSVRFGVDGGAVHLFGLNSVVHDRGPNAFALGEIKEDRWWQRGKRRPDDGVQLAQLAALVDSLSKPGDRHVRIVVTHHPVFYPRPRPLPISMVMENDATVAGCLDGPSPGGVRPLAHLVLSGHTHELHPGPGSLAIGSVAGGGSQLVIGSLMQRSSAADAHQVQLLRFFYPDDPQAKYVRMRRIWATRSSGAGDYADVDVSDVDITY